MRNDIVLATQGLTRRFGGLVAVNDVNFDVKAHEIHAILGKIRGASHSKEISNSKLKTATFKMNQFVNLKSPICTLKFAIENLQWNPPNSFVGRVSTLTAASLN